MPHRFGRTLFALALSTGLLYSSTAAAWADGSNAAAAPAAAPAAAAPAGANATTETDTELVQSTVTPFPDVPENHWAFEAISQLAADGYIKGYPNGKFEGARPMTRYEVAYLVSEAVSSLKDSIATGGHASQPDIDALKKLLSTFGTEVADLQNRVAKLESQTQALSGQVSALQAQTGAIQAQTNAIQETANKNRVSFQDIFRTGSLGQFAEVRSTLPVTVAGHVIPAGQVLPAGLGPAPVGSGVLGTLSGVGAPSTIYSGQYDNGYTYDIFRLDLDGESENTFRYGLRMEARLAPQFKNSISQTAPAYCTALPPSTVASTTTGAITSNAVGCTYQDYPNPAFNLQYAWAGWYHNGFFTRLGRIALDEGPYMSSDDAFAGSQQNMIQTGYLGRRFTLEGDVSMQDSGLLNSIVGSCLATMPCNSTTFGIQVHTDYYFPATRTDVGFSADNWSNLPASVWNAKTATYQTVNTTISSPDAFLVQYFGGHMCPNSTPTFGCDHPLFRAIARWTERTGNNPLTGAPWIGKVGWFGELIYSSKGGNWFTGPYYVGQGIKGSNLVQFQFFNTGANGFGADNGTQATTTINNSFLYPQGGSLLTWNLAVGRWLTNNVRVALLYEHFNNLPNVFIPAGSTTCPGCYVDAFHANTVQLDTFFDF